MATSGTKRKLVCQTLETKYNALKELDDGKSKKDIEKEFNVNRNTLNSWIKNSDKIKQQFEKGDFDHKTKKRRLAKNPDVEKALFTWFNDNVKKDASIAINKDDIVEKAKDFAEMLNVDTFNPSNGWFSRFKKRHNLAHKRLCGEGSSADLSQLDQWDEKLQNILQTYQPKDIFNADETALFFKCTPDKTYRVKGQAAKGGKQPKERLSLLVAANMDGSQKLDLLLIGKFKKPRCFKNVQHLPVPCEANAKAWMTSTVFTQWVQKLDRKMHIEKRKIALIIDNCSAHPDIQGLEAVKLIFLPPNTTSITQPMDQGIINNLKYMYRKLLAQKKIACLDAGESFNIDILQAMHSLKKAWENVKSDTIQNCFMHAFTFKGNADSFEGFTSEEIETDDHDKQLFEAVGLEKNEFIAHAITADDDAESCIEQLDDASIIAGVRPENDANEDNEEDESKEHPIVSSAAAFNMLESLRDYFLQSSSANDKTDNLDLIEQLTRAVEQEHLSKKKQKTIMDMFRKKSD